MSSHYPPGVTGMEPQIAGVEEFDEERDCEVCEEETRGFTAHMHGAVYEWTCAQCHTFTEEYEDEPELDRDDIAD